MGWRLAESLIRLREQVDGSAPGRDKHDDGAIGDARHQAEHSDHNPNKYGVVQALDLTHSPNKGFDSYKFADILQQNRDRRIKYIISNRRIFSPQVEKWAWRSYHGSDPHTGHIHISVQDSPKLYDDATDWHLAMEPPPPAKVSAGRGSWFSQYHGKYVWRDNEDAPNSNALGVPDSQQGIALP